MAEAFAFEHQLATPSPAFHAHEMMFSGHINGANHGNINDPVRKSNGAHSQKKKRQRVSRACDRCNRRRVRCDGNMPCSRCTVPEECKFTREARKRGKPVRRQSTAASSSRSDDDDQSSHDRDHVQSQPYLEQSNLGKSARHDGMAHHSPNQARHRHSFDTQRSVRSHSNDSRRSSEGIVRHLSREMPPTSHPRTESLDISTVGKFQVSTPAQAFGLANNSDIPVDPNMSGIPPFTGENATYDMFDSSQLLTAESAGPTTWKLPAESRYPVLRPLLPYTRSFLTASQTCSLLELYFTSAFKDNLHPVCRHIHAYLFRKSSVLNTTSPRNCSPALLASMLWAAAETGGPDMLSWPHTKRKSVSRKLYVLTIQLLRPLIHVDMGCAHWTEETGEIKSACVQHPGKQMDAQRDLEMPYTENQGTLDDVITYIHVAAITSASEHKAASMRWWHAAFSLARELKLNKETAGTVSNNMSSETNNANELHMKETETDPWFGLSSFNFDQGLMDFMEAPSEASPVIVSDQQLKSASGNEESREEARRTWWLLYIQDRHLALCYNRNLALLDAECADLLLPLDEAVWQSGSFLSDNSPLQRPVFPSFECTGHNLFGFFLPLMTIVGEILDHNHAKNHPLLGMYYRNTEHAQGIESEISRQLKCYEESLHTFEAIQIPQDQTIDFSTHQHALHTKTVVAYATHVTQVLHILLAGKWDPVSLFDNEDHWMSSPSFTTTMAHAIYAADAVSQILEVDPDLSFMPYFLGIQLLQGSFVLLLIIDRLQTKTEPRIINACEIIIRATEACVATLDTEYQRNYRQILRSAVVQARGRYVPQKESQYRRRAVLTLYRWTRNGTGLAL